MFHRSIKPSKFFMALAAAGFFMIFYGASAHADNASTTVPTGATSTVATGTAAATSTAATSTKANAPTVVVDACAPNVTDLAQIGKIQNDPTLSYTDEIKQELAVRKQLLQTTIVCAKSKAEDLEKSLNGLSVTGDSATLATTLSGKLSDAINFYSIELGKLDGVGIAGSKDIAKEILAYRMGSYDLLAGAVNNFIIWKGNQGLFKAAATRMDETNRAATFLENAAPSADLQNAMNAARASFQDAKTRNQAAEQALLQLQPPEQSLTLIQQSLQSLSDTYHQFFNVSTIIKGLLPQ
jgi:hypothetical protein